MNFSRFLKLFTFDNTQHRYFIDLNTFVLTFIPASATGCIPDWPRLRSGVDSGAISICSSPARARMTSERCSLYHFPSTFPASIASGSSPGSAGWSLAHFWPRSTLAAVRLVIGLAFGTGIRLMAGCGGGLAFSAARGEVRGGWSGPFGCGWVGVRGIGRFGGWNGGLGRWPWGGLRPGGGAWWVGSDD